MQNKNKPTDDIQKNLTIDKIIYTSLTKKIIGNF
jgi:hypothetical protein